MDTGFFWVFWWHFAGFIPSRIPKQALWIHPFPGNCTRVTEPAKARKIRAFAGCPDQRSFFSAQDRVRSLQSQILVNEYDFGLHAERSPVGNDCHAANPVRRIAVIALVALCCTGRLSPETPGIQRT